MPPSPWEHLQEQVVLGGKRFLEQLRQHVKGNAREQRGAARLATGRPELVEVIATVEQIKGSVWPEFRDKHGDSGRDLVLYAGQRVCRMKLAELAAAAGMKDYGAVSSAIRRFERLMKRREVERQQWKQVCQKYNIQM
jgi:hypothetical protein